MIRCIVCAFALVLVAGFSGCSSMGGGVANGQAQVTVTNVLEPQIASKAEDVFFRHGFEFKGSTEGKMEFERTGGTMDTVLYGNWAGDPMTTRVTLYIIRKDPATFALRSRAVIITHSFGGDSDEQHFDVQGARYKVILDKIAKELSAENAPAGAR
jgi:hypothetical protein